jgi:tetratricopeptide (TPR) repeat protein
MPPTRTHFQHTPPSIISAIEENPSRLEPQTQFSSALKNDSPSNRVNIVKRVLFKHPRDLWLSSQLVEAYIAAGDYDSAFKVLLDWYQKDSGRWVDDLLNAAVRRSPPHALFYLNELRTRFPNDSFVLLQVGIAHGACGDPARAIESVNEASKNLSMHNSELRLWITKAYSAFGDDDRAFTKLSEWYQENRARMYVHDGLEYAVARSPDKARFYLNKLLTIFPKDTFLLEQMSVAYSSCGDSTQAIEFVERALKNLSGTDDPKATQLRLVLADFHSANNNYQAVLDTLDKISYCTNDLRTKVGFRKLETLLLMESFPLAFEFCSKFMRSRTYSKNDYDQLASILNSIEDSAQRVEAWRRLSLEFPYRIPFYKELHSALKKNCDTDITIAAWRDLLMQVPESEYPFERLCEALKDDGSDDDRAIKVWEELWLMYTTCERFAMKLRRARSKRVMKEDMDVICAICMVHEMTTILYPCGHPFCESCANVLKVCPNCRSEIKDRKKVYVRLSHLILEGKNDCSVILLDVRFGVGRCG